MTTPRLEASIELDGWDLFSALLEVSEDAAGKPLADLRADVTRRVREQFVLDGLAMHPTVAALRRLFRAAGTDPTRYRPSSEALVRRLLKGSELPEINPLVDLNNCLSALLAVPCCVMAEGTFSPPLTLRSGEEGESYESLRGPFQLAGRPLLADGEGPCDAPITGSQRVKVTPETERAWLVAYLPAGVVGQEEASALLDQLLAAAPSAHRIH